MRFKCFLAAAFGLITMIVSVQARAPQESRDRAWRGVGPQPCMGTPTVGYYKCPSAPEAVALRAGRLFDSKTGRMLTKQLVLIQGDRIMDVGPEGQVK
ncbi:MAG: hypothetical protein DMG20_15345, partial [Acidobacteria bacterium]